MSAELTGGDSCWPRSPRNQQLAHLRSPALIERAKAALERLRRDKLELDRSLQDIIAGDPELQATATLLKGTPGAGPVLLATLLAELPELGQLDGAGSPAWSASLRSPGTAA
jgi:hypothetical protein